MPLLQNVLAKRLNLQWPLIQAPLGGLTTAELVAKVSNTGVLGSLGAAYLSPALIEQTINDIKKRTSRPFAVNLFAPAALPKINQEQITAALNTTQRYRQELELAEPSVRLPFDESFSEQFAVILRNKPAVFSFTFGLISKEMLKECRQQQIITFGTATTVEEGLLLEEYGVDGVIAQGVEAGGHRGMFSPTQSDTLTSTFVLTRSLVKSLKVPVIASGGIMDGAGIAAALMLGAQAVQLGTAFLLCPEMSTPAAYRQELRHAKGEDTMLTQVFSGRWARGIKNRFMLEMALHPENILPFPAQNAFTRELRKKAAALGKAEYLSLWAGQGVGLIREMPTEKLIQTLYEETVQALNTQQSSLPHVGERWKELDGND